MIKLHDLAYARINNTVGDVCSTHPLWNSKNAGLDSQAVGFSGFWHQCAGIVSVKEFESSDRPPNQRRPHVLSLTITFILAVLRNTMQLVNMCFLNTRVEETGRTSYLFYILFITDKKFYVTAKVLQILFLTCQLLSYSYFLKWLPTELLHNSVSAIFSGPLSGSAQEWKTFDCH